MKDWLLLKKMKEEDREEIIKTVIQFIKFGIVGVSNTVINLVVYWICFNFFHINYMISQTIAFFISVINAFYWNYKYVFKQEEGEEINVGKSYIKVVASYGSTFILSLGLLYLWVDLLGINENIAPVISLLITIPLNYLLNRFWAFK